MFFLTSLMQLNRSLGPVEITEPPARPDLPHDGSIPAQLVSAVVGILADLAVSGAAVFKTVDRWNFQVEGSSEKAARLAPFAYVTWMDTKPRIEGGQNIPSLTIAVLVGASGPDPRIGGGTAYGLSALRDMVIGALYQVHPGGDLVDYVESFHFAGGEQLVDSPRLSMAELWFETRQLKILTTEDFETSV